MIWSGKLIAGAIGNLIGGPLAALFAVGIGHTLDREIEGFRRAFLRQRSSEWRQHWHDVAFAAEFLLAGYLFTDRLARPDESDVCFDSIASRRVLNRNEREHAWALFREGQRLDFPLTELINQVRRETHRQREQVIQLLTGLRACLYSDRCPSQGQVRALFDIARRFAIAEERLASYASAWAKYRREASTRRSASIDEASAYRILGLSAEATETEVRRAYRLQISRHHPDKLMHTNPSDERLAKAANHTDLIRKAFDAIKRSRGW